MVTLAQLRTRILAKIDDGLVERPTAAQVTDQINSTIDFYERDAFWFNQAIASLTATVGDPILDMSSVTDFGQLLEPNGLVYVSGNITYPVEKITPLQYDSNNTDAIGPPWYYTYRAGRIELLFYPDQAYEMRLFYQRKYTDLVNDSDSNAFTDNASRLIEYRTLSDLLRDYRSDFERANAYAARADEELDQVRKETYNRTATGNLVTENIVNTSDSSYGFYDCY